MPLRFAVLFALFGVSYGLINSLSIEYDDRPTFLVDSFGFEKGGVFKVEIKEFSLMVPREWKPPADQNKYKVGFVLQMSTVDGISHIEYNGTNQAMPECFHESTLREGDELISMASRNDWMKKVFEKTIDKPGYYQLYFFNCEVGTKPSFSLTVTKYNVDAQGQKLHLPAGKENLPTWFGGLCVMFVVELVVWFVVLCREKSNIRSIHHLMTLCLILKILTLLFEALKEDQTKVTGLKPNGWTAVYYFFSFLNDSLMFAVIVLIGAGWSYLNPSLTEWERRTLWAVLLAQVMINIAMVVVDQVPPGTDGWTNWRDFFLAADIICCCIALFPTMWSIHSLRKAATKDVAAHFARLNFRYFFVLVAFFVFFTRINVPVLGFTLSYETAWLSDVLCGLASLITYGFTGYLFCPQPDKSYLALSDEIECSPAIAMTDQAKETMASDV